MGRKKKQAPELVRVAECLDITLHSDVMNMRDLADFPNIDSESDKNKLIMMATACGYSQAKIGKAFNVTQSTIFDIIHRIDPDGMFRLKPSARTAFITRLAESRCVEALSCITPEKLEESSAKELMGIAKDYVVIKTNLNQSKHAQHGGSRLDSLMEAMEVERQNDNIEDAEIIEETSNEEPPTKTLQS